MNKHEEEYHYRYGCGIHTGVGCIDSDGWSRIWSGYGQQSRLRCPPVSNLTPEQSTKIQALQQANLTEITPLQEQLYAKKTELRTLWASQTPDQARINALQKDILNINAKLQEKSTNARFEMKKILTTEQQAQLNTYGPGMHHGMGGRMGRR